MVNTVARDYSSLSVSFRQRPILIFIYMLLLTDQMWKYLQIVWKVIINIIILTYLLTYLLTDIPTYLLTYLLTYRHTHLPTYWLTDIPTYLLTYLLTYRHIYLPTYLLTYLLTDLQTYLPTYLLTYRHTYLPTYLLTYLLTYRHTYLPTYLRTYLLTYRHTYLCTYLLTYLPTYLLQLNCHSMAVVHTLIQTKQIRINIHKRNNTKTQYKQYKRVYTNTHTKKTPTQLKGKYTANLKQQQITCQQFYKQPLRSSGGATQCSFDNQAPNYK